MQIFSNAEGLLSNINSCNKRSGISRRFVSSGDVVTSLHLIGSAYLLLRPLAAFLCSTIEHGY